MMGGVTSFQIFQTPRSSLLFLYLFHRRSAAGLKLQIQKLIIHNIPDNLRGYGNKPLAN